MMLRWLTKFKGFSATIVTELPVKTLNEIEYYCGFERKLRSNSSVIGGEKLQSKLLRLLIGQAAVNRGCLRARVVGQSSE